MKKLFTLTIMLFVFIANSLASDFVTINGFKFLIDEDKKEATLVPNDYAGDLEIPESAEYNGVLYPVKALGSNCFGKAVTSVKIPSSVTELKENCFANSSIKEISLPSSVTVLGIRCFSWCEKLETISLSNIITSLPTQCFSSCFKLKNINLPSNLKTIGYLCFDSCWELESILMPEGLESIGSCSFWHCTSLKSITLPATLKYIGSEFLRDTQLDNITCKAKIPPTEPYENEYDIFGSFPKEACTLYVPSTCLAAYQSDENWRGFGVYKAIEGSSDETNGIIQVKARQIFASFIGNTLSIQGLSEGESVSVYTIDGVLISKGTAASGIANIEVGNPDIVIAKVGSKSIKVAR